MSRPTTPLPASVSTALRLTEARSKQESPSVLVPAPSRKREPYTVERYPAVGGVRMLGFDASGEPAIDITIARHRYKPEMLTKLQRWLMRDEPEAQARPALSIAK